MDFIDYTNAKRDKHQKKLYVGTDRGVILTIDITDLLQMEYDYEYSPMPKSIGGNYDDIYVEDFKAGKGGMDDDNDVIVPKGVEPSDALAKILEEQEKITKKKAKF